MATGSRVCSQCGALNGAEEKRCHRCDRRLPGPLAQAVLGLWTTAFGESYPLTKLMLVLSALVFVMSTLASGAMLAGDGSPFDRLLFGGMPRSQAVRWGAAFTMPPQAFHEPYRLGLLSPWIAEEPWRLLSATFLHFGVLHIGFNSAALWQFRALEERLGGARFVLIFLLTSVAGFYLSDQYYSFSARAVPTGGMSAGLFGLVAALVGYLYGSKDPSWKRYFGFAAFYGILFGFMPFINSAAHLGGFVLGLPLGYLFYRENRPWRLALVFRILAGVLVVASLASLGLAQTSPLWREIRVAEIQRGQ